MPDITNLATKTTLDVKIIEVKSEIPSITNLARTAALNTKTNEFKNKMFNISNLSSTTALTAIENKIPDHSKYITTSKFNKLAAENFPARLAQANLLSKSDIASFIKKINFDDKLKNLNKKVTSIKSKHLLVKIN